MSVSSVVFATEQGIGRLARDFYDHGFIHNVLVAHHSSRKNHYDWYPNRASSYEELFAYASVFFCIETPILIDALHYAKRRGVRTILMPMYECTQDSIADKFDVILNPSLLDQITFPRGTHIQVPVSVTWRLRRKAKIFVHNAGHGGIGGRNGTKELLEAMQYVKSPLTLIIRTQETGITSDDPRVKIITGTVPFDDLWRIGDVFVFPEKFNGLSLPLQEAFAAGMAVMTSDRFPNNMWLPREPLIPTAGYTHETVARRIDVAIINPKDIAKKMDEFYGTDIERLSLLGRKYNRSHSWNRLKKTYATVLGSSSWGVPASWGRTSSIIS